MVFQIAVKELEWVIINESGYQRPHKKHRLKPYNFVFFYVLLVTFQEVINSTEGVVCCCYKVD